MSVTIGWWAVPTIITAIVMLWGCAPNSGNEYRPFDVVGVLQFLGAIIVSLVAWLVWALVA